MMVCKDFELRWPARVDETISYISIFSTSQKNVLSFDCIFLLAGFSRLQAFYLKILLFGIAPIVLSAIGCIFWFLIWTAKSRPHNFQIISKMRLTSFIIIQLMYPTITTITF